MKRRDMLIWLNSLRGATNRYIDCLESYFPEISDLWDASPGCIYSLQGIGDTFKASIVSERSRQRYENIVEIADKKGIDIITIDDEVYPENLKDIPDAPKVLYLKGSLDRRDEASISIVGPRKATPYGIWVADKLSRELSRLGVTIVSGMALGVDAASHIAALEEGGRTVAVLGTGVDIVYPERNRHIYERIVRSGAVVSEFSVGTKGLPYRFPQRNRIISGMSLGTVIVEAGFKSGTLTTAQHGLEQGREIFAVPGNINSPNSEGTNALIKDGAKLVQGIDDIVCEIGQLKATVDNCEGIERGELDLSEKERTVFRALLSGPKHLEEIAVVSETSIPELMGLLTVLELKKKVRKVDGSVFSLL